MKFTLPFNNPEKYPITQRFGEKFMYGGKMCTHKGVDYAMPKNTMIIAPFDGIIDRTTPERTTGYGKAVYLRAKDDKNVVALMAHLSSILGKEGLKVKRGNIVGYSGRTGFWRGVNGYHLHLGFSVCNTYLDPLPMLKVKKEQAENLFNQDDSKLKVRLGNYTVVEGDSLWKISEKYYKNGGHYIEIFRANEDIIEDMNLIYPGQVLRIPALKNKGI